MPSKLKSPALPKPKSEVAGGDADEDLDFVPIERDRPRPPESEVARAEVLAGVDLSAPFRSR